MRFRCVQPGHECEFEADERPTHCPVCKYPFAGEAIDAISLEATDDEVPWSDYSLAELQGYARDWNVEGWNSRTPKADLITLLEAAEAE